MNQRGETIGRLACIGVLIASLAGCSAKRDVSARDVAAEPELRGMPVVPPLRTSDSGLVPVVIALGRPIGASAAVMRVSSPPRRLATESAVVRPISDATVGVRELLASYTEAFNRHDVAELAAHWASDGENLDLASGDVTKGRDAIRDVFKSLFETDDAATIDVGITSIRPVQSDVALVDGTSRVTFADGLEAGSRFAAVARAHGLDVVDEAFCDRRYRADGTLVPRGSPTACIDDAAAAADGAVRLAAQGSIRADDGSDLVLHAGTLCVHGDGPAAVAIARAVRRGLSAAGIRVRAPATGRARSM